MGKPKNTNPGKTKAGPGTNNGGNAKLTTASIPAAPPAWPQFKPSLPVADLAADQLASCPDKVILIRNFWPKSLCSSYVTFLRGLPLVTTPGRPKRGEAVRVNDRFQVQDAAFAQRLWTETGLRESLAQEDIQGLWGGEVVGLNPNIRIYRYSKGQYFDAHCKSYGHIIFLSSNATHAKSARHSASQPARFLPLHATRPTAKCSEVLTRLP
ncbi:hypothetical protein CORC01_01213 [Colletotrichum orchidophilum]|uniref:Uncharacterized protein n=1 Tax=Colletotrichum orchidophilum TaxID=1209926 RepID=A0A1G4BPZ6_9PEZI|nr:uncharacterized protein CORC01_01213 [Colletotrichum orchidophilum]OHF03494.1 hypothetical protein CORC01_01213 [Colletotrichum orchidophilum]